MVKLKAGDHISINRKGGVYAHHGIYVGGDQVIHYSGEPGQEGKRKAPIRRTTLEKFADGGEVRVLKYRFSPEADEVIARAEGKIGQKQYNLAVNNCEHFAVWCKTGRAESLQANGAGELFGGIGGGAVGAGGAVLAVSWAGAVPGLSAAGITSGLAAIGLGAGMIGGIAIVAGTPVVLGGFGCFVGRKVVHWWRSERAEVEAVPLLPPPSNCDVAVAPEPH